MDILNAQNTLFSWFGILFLLIVYNKQMKGCSEEKSPFNTEVIYQDHSLDHLTKAHFLRIKLLSFKRRHS